MRHRRTYAVLIIWPASGTRISTFGITVSDPAQPRTPGNAVNTLHSEQQMTGTVTMPLAHIHQRLRC
jgi:hypothetical protein